MSHQTMATKAREARKAVLTMIHRAGTSHIASNFSVIDIATVLYENLKKEDRVVWSKGWAAASIYYFGVQRGELKPEVLEKFPNAPFLGLAETTVPGVLCNGGAVGHGSPIAVGLAMAKKLLKEPGIVYCIMSDGELNEGSVWESAMMAVHHKLDNLVFIIDANGWQAMGRTEDVCNANTFTALGALGFKRARLDGHNHKHIQETLEEGWQRKDLQDMPKVMWCDTIKGKGVSFMENHLLYHYKNVDKETYEKAMAELSV